MIPRTFIQMSAFHLYPLKFPSITQKLKLMILHFVVHSQLAKPSLFPIVSFSGWHSLSYNLSLNPRNNSWHFSLLCAPYSIHHSIIPLSFTFLMFLKSVHISPFPFQIWPFQSSIISLMWQSPNWSLCVHSCHLSTSSVFCNQGASFKI